MIIKDNCTYSYSSSNPFPGLFDIDELLLKIKDVKQLEHCNETDIYLLLDNDIRVEMSFYLQSHHHLQFI